MGRKRRHAPLRVLLNNRIVGQISKETGGGTAFRYDESWLAWERASPVSLSLPLREDAYKGAPVTAVFENLLPDSEALRGRIAQRVAADGTDSYSLLSRIGRDCVGALQFIPADDDAVHDNAAIEGESISHEDIEKLLNNLGQAPLGLDRNQDFRISVAGAQEKTALLYYKGKWRKPHGMTPTTHILKTQIGALPNGIDLSNSVENEYFCLKLLSALGLPVNAVEIRVFGKTKALVIERFDRTWTTDGRLLRVPQEDCCQALSIPPARKYQNEGGPGMVDILTLLRGSDTPAEDQKTFLKAQIFNWLIGATDGHAKNFSIFLGPAGRFSMTPLYDVLTAQPRLDSRQIVKKQMKLAMSVGDKRHYTMDYIQGRHFMQTVKRAGLPEAIAQSALEEVANGADAALNAVEEELPAGFSEEIYTSVRRGLEARLAKI